MAKPLDGTEVSLASLKGKPVVLVFWASWAGDSVAILPALSDQEPKFKDRLVAAYTVCVGDEPEIARKVVASSKLRLPVLLDSKDLAAASFGIRCLPTTVIIGPDGTVRSITRETKDLPIAREAIDGPGSK